MGSWGQPSRPGSVVPHVDLLNETVNRRYTQFDRTSDAEKSNPTGTILRRNASRFITPADEYSGSVLFATF